MLNQRRVSLNASPDHLTDATGYTHILCGTYTPTARFDDAEIVSIRSRDPRKLVRCPECLVSTELRSFLPTNRDDETRLSGRNNTPGQQTSSRRGFDAD